MNDEHELINRLAAHDEEAFHSLYQLYVRRIHRFVSNYVKEKEDVNDLCQTIFIKLWERRGMIDVTKPFSSYLFSMSYTATMDFFRKQSKELAEHSISVGLLNDSIAAGNKTDDLVIYRQMNSIYEKALELLPDRRREVFVLSRHHGLSNKEIAEKLGISIKTVENQMTAALASLKNYLAGAGMLAFYFFIF